RQLTTTADKEVNPVLSPDGSRVAFTRNNNLFTQEIASGKETQHTTDGSELILNGYASWVYFEEILGRASRYRAFWWSPDGKQLGFMRFDDTEVPLFYIYNNEGQHGFNEKTRYPKAGDKNPEVKVGLVDMATSKTVWADFNPKDDQYFGTPIWTPSGKFWVQWMNRDQNNLKIFEIEPGSGVKKEVYDEKQTTWIDLDDNDRIEFLPDGRSYILKSDKTGWMHMYYYDATGKLLNQITEGEYTVGNVLKIDEKAKLVYFTARKENSARWDLYKTGLNGKGLTRLTFGEFTHNVRLSPGGKYFISTYSNITTPSKMALVDAKGKIIRELGDSKGADFDKYKLAKTEIVRVKSSDGLFELPMTITYPIDFDPAKKYPVLISIYGGPNAGTVYDAYPRSALASQWWAKEGMIQVAMDNRSSGHFGKKGMNFIHRQLGKWETEDYITCAKWLREKSFVDTTAVAMTGGSFGGYMTCMALTYGAGTFTHGIANYSVTDWSLYDTHYTERFMDKPQDNPEGYKNTSPMTYANKYKGLLRIVHGSSDDNVHMQNSIQLVNKLEMLNKHFEFMVYPGERHGWGGAKAIHSRNEAYLFYYNNLLKKPMPPIFWGGTEERRGF
ncbi:MAG: S9 family peptidase, partial [Gemmatimonadaceae bacterium]|nr:S9 family peptidase [Chitinophagaceae bacterium]